ncbi:hypothetical protein CDCA_CDCA11G3113 [Cyanidium caldarium]|uniref:Uncharacterized protein n=1 Tax=Cyanidium caldarium TaxID=2771 RepID=A0AAV9IXQ1_CYACA|nr:hypothetical protein CDCA_CDCA11G3113 [Cyanidium caldarium]
MSTAVQWSSSPNESGEYAGTSSAGVRPARNALTPAVCHAPVRERRRGCSLEAGATGRKGSKPLLLDPRGVPRCVGLGAHCGDQVGPDDEILRQTEQQQGEVVGALAGGHVALV